MRGTAIELAGHFDARRALGLAFAFPHHRPPLLAGFRRALVCVVVTGLALLSARLSASGHSPDQLALYTCRLVFRQDST